MNNVIDLLLFEGVYNTTVSMTIVIVPMASELNRQPYAGSLLWLRYGWITIFKINSVP